MILAVIPARSGSKGLAGKNLRSFGGVPLILHTIKAAQDSAFLDDCLVSTDSDDIASVARGAGANVPFRRPPELATDESSVWDVVRHAVQQWEQQTKRRLDAVALLQPTSPLRLAEDIDACIRKFLDLEADFCATGVVSHDSPYFNMVECTPASSFVRACSPVMHGHIRRQNAPPVYALNGAVYVAKRSLVDSIHNQFHVERFALSVMPPERSVDIDSSHDFDLAQWLFSRRNGAGAVDVV